MKYRITIIIFLNISIHPILNGQDTLSTFYVPHNNQSIFDSLIKEVQYPETLRELFPKEFKSEKKKKKRKEHESKTQVFNFIVIIFTIVLILVILYLVISRFSTKKDLPIHENEISTIEDISEIDTLSNYNIAVDNGDYRMAIRMQFIRVLQILVEKQILIWKVNKTNRDYKNELGSHDFAEDFKYLSLIYDHAWYGNKTISKEVFDLYNMKFQSFINQSNA